MRSKVSLISLLFQALLTLTLLILSYQFDCQMVLKRERLKVELTQLLLKSLPELKKRWEIGDLENYYERNLLNCPEEIPFVENVDDLYLHFNPNYMQCFFSGKAGVPPHFSLLWKGKRFNIKAKEVFPAPPLYKHSSSKRYYTLVGRPLGEGVQLPPVGIMVELYVEGFPWWSTRVILAKTSLQSYLPQKIYGHEQFDLIKARRGEDWTWSNQERNLFIDRFLVTNRDIYEWKAYMHSPSTVEVEKDPRQWAESATHLKAQEMEDYCASMGKHWIDSTLYDAGTMYPSSVNWEEGIQEDHLESEVDPLSNDQGSEWVVRSSYPWVQTAQKSFLYPYHFEKKAVEKEVMNRENCQLIYTKDCRLSSTPYIWMNGQTVTWMGVGQTLGGPMEAMRNLLNPHSNLKASSWYFSYESQWHTLGKRAYWNGEGHLREHFDFADSYPLPEDDGRWRVGFRCVEEVGK